MIGPKVAGAIVLNVANHFDARVVGLWIDAQHQVLLIVAEFDVKARPMLLNEVVLEKQRFLLVLHHHGLDLD